MCLQGSWSEYHWCLDWGALYIEAAKQCLWSLTTRYSPSGCDCHTISDITNWFCTCQSKVVPSCPLLGLHMRKLPAVCADLTIIRSLPSLYKVSVSIQVTRTVCYANWVSKIDLEASSTESQLLKARVQVRKMRSVNPRMNPDFQRAPVNSVSYYWLFQKERLLW